ADLVPDPSGEIAQFDRPRDVYAGHREGAPDIPDRRPRGRGDGPAASADAGRAHRFRSAESPGAPEVARRPERGERDRGAPHRILRRVAARLGVHLNQPNGRAEDEQLARLRRESDDLLSEPNLSVAVSRLNLVDRRVRLREGLAL